jgi:hypothetical protein
MTCGLGNATRVVKRLAQAEVEQFVIGTRLEQTFVLGDEGICVHGSLFKKACHTELVEGTLTILIGWGPARCDSLKLWRITMW